MENQHLCKHTSAGSFVKSVFINCFLKSVWPKKDECIMEKVTGFIFLVVFHTGKEKIEGTSKTFFFPDKNKIYD